MPPAGAPSSEWTSPHTLGYLSPMKDFIMDRKFGLIHVKVQTWFPMAMQILSPSWLIKGGVFKIIYGERTYLNAASKEPLLSNRLVCSASAPEICDNDEMPLSSHFTVGGMIQRHFLLN
jgi:hypothetical protein